MLDAYEYVTKSQKAFEKKFPNFPKHLEAINCGKRNLPVFLDASLILQRGLPEVIKKELLKQANELQGLKRLNGLCCCQIEHKDEGQTYYIYLHSRTYNIFNQTSGRLLYSVIEVDSFVINVYRKDVYGRYEERPISSDSDRWLGTVKHNIYDLAFVEE